MSYIEIAQAAWHDAHRRKTEEKHKPGGGGKGKGARVGGARGGVFGWSSGPDQAVSTTSLTRFGGRARYSRGSMEEVPRPWVMERRVVV